MREDYLEALEKMFPDGYMIAYTVPQADGKIDVRISYYNPFRYDALFEYYDVLKENYGEK